MKKQLQFTLSLQILLDGNPTIPLRLHVGNVKTDQGRGYPPGRYPPLINPTGMLCNGCEFSRPRGYGTIDHRLHLAWTVAGLAT